MLPRKIFLNFSNQQDITTVAAISVGDSGDERHRREDRGAESADEGRVWKGGLPLPDGEGVWGPEKCSIFGSKRGVFVHSVCYFCS